MLFFIKARVEHRGMGADELWELWEKEAEQALRSKARGTIVSLYKISGQRRVIAILNVESHDELDRMVLADAPLAHHLEIEELLPLREYESFADDLRRRWQINVEVSPVGEDGPEA